MKHAFDKFINQERNSKKKEVIKQEKRKWKDEKKKKYDEKNKMNDARSREYNIKDSKSSNKNSGFKKYDQHSKSKGEKPVQTEGRDLSASEMPLNKFIAYAGVCGRREAAVLVKEGKIKVNNDIVYEPGFKVTQQMIKLYSTANNCFLKKTLCIFY